AQPLHRRTGPADRPARPVAHSDGPQPPMNPAPPVNYRLPILATIASTVVVMVLFTLLAFFTAAWSLRQFTGASTDETGSPIIGGLCGVATLALIAGIVYFALALIKGVRDLTMPIQRLPGYIERKYTGMGRT